MLILSKGEFLVLGFYILFVSLISVTVWGGSQDLERTKKTIEKCVQYVQFGNLANTKNLILIDPQKRIFVDAKKLINDLWRDDFSKREEVTDIQKFTKGFGGLLNRLPSDSAYSHIMTVAYLAWLNGDTHGFSKSMSRDDRAAVKNTCADILTFTVDRAYEGNKDLLRTIREMFRGEGRGFKNPLLLEIMDHLFISQWVARDIHCLSGWSAVPLMELREMFGLGYSLQSIKQNAEVMPGFDEKEVKKMSDKIFDDSLSDEIKEKIIFLASAYYTKFKSYHDDLCLDGKLKLCNGVVRNDGGEQVGLYFYESNEAHYVLANVFDRAPFDATVSGIRRKFGSSERFFQACKAFYRVNSVGESDNNFIDRINKCFGRESQKANQRLKLREEWHQFSSYVMMCALWKKMTCLLVNGYTDPVSRRTIKDIMKGPSGLLVEHTQHDAFWGDGSSDENLGTGENKLGCLLMAIRDTFITID